MYESGVTCSGRTPRSSTLSILPPPPFPLIAHGVHARTPTTKSKPATVRVEGRGMYLLPRFAHPCACVCLCARVIRQLRSFLPIFPLSLENFEKNMRILDSKMEMEEIEKDKGKEERVENSRWWWFFEIPISSYERCPELLLLAAPYAALLRAPCTGVERGTGEGCVWKIGAT